MDNDKKRDLAIICTILAFLGNDGVDVASVEAEYDKAIQRITESIAD